MAKDLVIWYFGPAHPGKISNEPPNTADLPIYTYSTYRVMYRSGDDNTAPDNNTVPPALDSSEAGQGVTLLQNCGINFSETYVNNDENPEANEYTTENYSTFSINLGYKSVNGTMYGLATSTGIWPPNSIVLGTIPNLGVFAGSAATENKLPYKYIRFNTYDGGWRRVHLSVNKIGKTDPIPADLANPDDFVDL